MNMQHLFSPLKYTLLCSTVVLTLGSVAAAKTMYVQPSSEIPVRRGQGTDYKIVSIVADGTALEYLSEAEGWAKVRLKNGKQGWILKRYLSTTLPLTEQVARLTREKEELSTQLTALQAQLQGVTDVQGNTAAELSTCIAERANIRDKYVTLEQDTADVIQTKAALEKARTEIERLQQENEAIKIANSVLEKNESIKWFMAGSGVILAGWLLGRISRSSKRKKPSLLS
ncbi:MAG: hypothetical protein CSB34_00365 [Desulfobulbus propionicus]|nr:MAG: hypothetical protein CSB34_00365 [Desulfobulbus propionicus]